LNILANKSCHDIYSQENHPFSQNVLLMVQNPLKITLKGEI